MRMEIVRLVAEGDTVVGRFTCSPTHTGQWRGQAATQRRFENVDEVYVFEFEDGRIAEV
jgi:predicted ester cyclase